MSKSSIRSDIENYLNNTNVSPINTTLKCLNRHLPGINKKINNILHKNYKADYLKDLDTFQQIKSNIINLTIETIKDEIKIQDISYWSIYMIEIIIGENLYLDKPLDIELSPYFLSFPLNNPYLPLS